MDGIAPLFSSPSSGTFFQSELVRSSTQDVARPSFRPLSRGLFFNLLPFGRYGKSEEDVFVPSLGDFFSIEREQIETTRYVRFRPLSRGLFFNRDILQNVRHYRDCFRPLSRGLFFNMSRFEECGKATNVFVPSLGDFFSIACLRSPSPSALASAFAAGMGGSLHQALSFGDKMPISPVRAGIGGDL